MMDEDSIQDSVAQLLAAIDINQLDTLRRDHNGHPLLLEVERIISWLELFNVLLNGLVRLNGLLEKSHICQEKLAYLIRKSKEKKARLRSIAKHKSLDGSEDSSRSSSGSGPEEIVDLAVVDSLADKVASLLQMTSPTKLSKIRRLKTKNNQPALVDTEKSIETLGHAELRRNTKSKVTDTSIFSVRTNKTSKRKNLVELSKSTTPKEVESQMQNSKNALKLTSWFVEFPDDRRVGKQRVKVMKDAPEKLPQIFEKKCKHLKERSKKRAEIITTKAMVRKLTSEERLRRAVAECVRENREREARRDDGIKWSQSTPYDYTVKNGIKMKRIFTHKQMRDQTERMYVKLPEVVQREKEMKKEESKRVHRVMKQVFNHQMKRSISHGQLNFPITQNFTVY